MACSVPASSDYVAEMKLAKSMGVDACAWRYIQPKRASFAADAHALVFRLTLHSRGELWWLGCRLRRPGQAPVQDVLSRRRG